MRKSLLALSAAMAFVASAAPVGEAPRVVDNYDGTTTITFPAAASGLSKVMTTPTGMPVNYDGRELVGCGDLSQWRAAEEEEEEGEEQNLVTMNFRLVFAEGQIKSGISWLYVLNEDYFGRGFLFTDGDVTPDADGNYVNKTFVQVPESGAEVVLVYNGFNDCGLLVLTSGRVVPGEGDNVVTLNVADAVRHYAFRGVDPQGTPLTFTRGNFGPEGFVTTSEGNVGLSWCDTNVLHKVYGPLATMGTTTDFVPDTAPADIEPADVYTNVSDPEWVFINNKQYEMPSGAVYSVMQAQVGGGADVTVNSPDSYRSLSPEFVNCPYYSQVPHYGKTAMNTTYFYAGQWLYTLSMEGPGNYWGMQLSGNNEDVPQFVWGALYGDEQASLDDGWGGYYYYFTESPFYLPKSEQFSISPLFNVFNEDSDALVAQEPTTYAYTPAQLRQPFGNGPTVVSVNNQLSETFIDANDNWWQDDDEPTFVNSYVSPVVTGLAGDVRQLNAATAVRSASYNGETVVAPGEDFNEVFEQWASQGHGEGRMEYTIVDRNWALGSVEGETKSVSAVTWGADDCVAPTVTSVVIRDKDGNIGYDFDSVEGLILTVSAVDGDYIDYVWNFSAPASVQMYAGVHGAKTLDEAPLLAMDSFQAGVGSTYLCSMVDVLTEECPDGVYDLRFVVEDAAGNTQTLDIKPGVRVSSLVGIEGVAADAEGAVSYYDLQGRRVMSPTSGLYIRETRTAAGTSYSKVIL